MHALEHSGPPRFAKGFEPTSANWDVISGPVTFPGDHIYMDSGTHKRNGAMAKVISKASITAPVVVEVDIENAEEAYGECFSVSIFPTSQGHVKKCSGDDKTISMSVGWGPPKGINTCGGGVSGLGHKSMSFKSVGRGLNRHKEKFEVTANAVIISIDMLDGKGYQEVNRGTGSFDGREGKIGFGDHCVRKVKIHSIVIDGNDGSGSQQYTRIYKLTHREGVTQRQRGGAGQRCFEIDR